MNIYCMKSKVTWLRVDLTLERLWIKQWMHFIGNNAIFYGKEPYGRNNLKTICGWTFMMNNNPVIMYGTAIFLAYIDDYAKVALFMIFMMRASGFKS